MSTSLTNFQSKRIKKYTRCNKIQSLSKKRQRRTCVSPSLNSGVNYGRLIKWYDRLHTIPECKRNDTNKYFLTIFMFLF